jgi:hypothetical protein
VNSIIETCLKENQAAYKTVCDSLEDADDRSGFSMLLVGVLMAVVDPGVFKGCIAIATEEYCKFGLNERGTKEGTN